MRGTAAALVLVLAFQSTMLAQEVNKAADWVSWGTAGVNATWGTVEALRGERPKCHLGQLAISSGIVIPTAFVLQHVVTSSRPCCPGNGMPSAHSAISVLGLAQPSPGRTFTLRLTIGFGSAGATAGLRQAANRHTAAQTLAGLLLGGAGEMTGQLLRCN